jgi:hypothetical protein
MRTVTGAPTLEKQFRVVARTFDRQLTELKVRAGVMQQNLSESDLVQENVCLAHAEFARAAESHDGSVAAAKVLSLPM